MREGGVSVGGEGRLRVWVGRGGEGMLGDEGAGRKEGKKGVNGRVQKQ